MMEVFKVFEVSASGMYAQRVRINVIASNLANYESYTREGEPYRRLEPVFEAVETPGNLSKGLVPVRVVEIRRSDAPFRLLFDPTNPRADRDGFVRLPNVDVTAEMVDMLSALRSYEANLTAFNATKEIVQRTLELWR
ncbi:flagellar basal-body rod protein FlgC [Thermocrinis albus DSM 14484]|uniref:Flagellar basal-body rod protein FlgC n=1 Tax=Thermocrinis albus (strain DSM 14484 / JCM 11386 / HI 11/12) TaxID=638303 RepID=D3SQ48_THEAH|nr:flagellar basal body rod protein FlgC [Thermocrinis albus]ADC89285.1 flagellar basal-body rod protein FlgC [Thermocrinis albus DSM 14484]